MYKNVREVDIPNIPPQRVLFVSTDKRIIRCKSCQGSNSPIDGYKRVNNWYITYLRDACMCTIVDTCISDFLGYIFSCSEISIFSISQVQMQVNYQMVSNLPSIDIRK